MIDDVLKEYLVKAILQRAKMLLGNNTMDSESLGDRPRNPGFNIVSGGILCLDSSGLAEWFCTDP